MNDLKNILNQLNNYVILRGFDTLHEKVPYLKNGDDIDLLLTNENDIINFYDSNIIKIKTLLYSMLKNIIKILLQKDFILV